MFTGATGDGDFVSSLIWRLFKDKLLRLSEEPIRGEAISCLIDMRPMRVTGLEERSSFVPEKPKIALR